MDSRPHETDGIPNKRCPFCAELIPDTEKKCRYCKEYLDPSLRGMYAGGVAYWDGDYLRVPLGGFIRDTHCIVCARSRIGKPVRKTFRHIPRWFYLLLILLPCVYTIVVIVVVWAVAHERQEVDVPLCDRCDDRWSRMATVFRLFGVLALFALPTVFGFIGNEVHPQGGGFYGAAAGLLVWGWGLFGLYALGLRRCAPTTRKIDKSSLLLRLPNASLIQTAWEEEK